jgi:hypothetical protein
MARHHQKLLKTQIHICVSFIIQHYVKNVFKADHTLAPVPVLTLHLVTGLMLGIY